MDDELRVTRVVVLDTPADDLWAMLTEPEELTGWLGEEVELVPAPGGAARIVERDGTERRGRVERVDAGRHLELTWWPATDESAASTVSFTLDEEDGDRTRLTVVEVPAGRATGGGRACSLVDAGEAWDDRLVGLELALLARPVLSPALA